MYLYFLPPRKSHGNKRELHITTNPDLIADLCNDAVIPLREDQINEVIQIDVGELSEHELNKYANFFIQSGFWVCWCSD